MENKFCKCLDQPSNFSERLALEKSKFWTNGQTLRVKFLSGTNSQKEFVKKTCVEWCLYANLKFEFVESGQSDIRITFDESDGAWSYIGTDCSDIPQNQPTMNLGWLDKGVVLHEFGHALGAVHEHQNPNEPIQWNEQQVVKDLSGPPNYWSYDMIKHNVFDRYQFSEVEATPVDSKSVMMYPIPSNWTLNGLGFPGGDELSQVDKDFIGMIYPLSTDTDEPVEPDPTDPVEPTPTGCLDPFKLFNSYKELTKFSKVFLVKLGTELGLDVKKTKVGILNELKIYLKL